MGNQATKYAPNMKGRELTKSGQFMQITVLAVRLRQLKEHLHKFQTFYYR